jgi:GMP synthase (glutamine-hydrolysing)
MTRLFDPKIFIDKQTAEIRRVLGEEKAMVACSGGVDSTTCAVLTHRAIGDNLVCIFIDTSFMRLGEPEEVMKTLSSPPLNMPVKLVNAKEQFLNALTGLKDAEEKRKSFRETFYQVLSEAARHEKTEFLVQGTIAPDVIETEGGIKTQHNVLEQIGINPVQKYGYKVIEPIATLVKPQVRQVAKMLGIPSTISERQPFPGPGLAVRLVGTITPLKLATEKKATKIVEEGLDNIAVQYFAAVIENEEKKDSVTDDIKKESAKFFHVDEDRVDVKTLKSRATGIRNNKREYGNIVTLKIKTESGEVFKPSLRELLILQEKILDKHHHITRLLFNLDKEKNGSLLVAIRAIKTSNFLKATPAIINWARLEKISGKILKDCHEVASICYDITPKPPSTIEFE